MCVCLLLINSKTAKRINGDSQVVQYVFVMRTSSCSFYKRGVPVSFPTLPVALLDQT